MIISNMQKNEKLSHSAKINFKEKSIAGKNFIKEKILGWEQIKSDDEKDERFVQHLLCWN